MPYESSTLRLAGYIADSVVDGPGFRLVVFTQGCPHRCLGCHNPHTHDPNEGKEVAVSDLVKLYQSNPLLYGLTLSGGDPFVQPAGCAALAEEVHALGGNVITYTGWLHEALLARAETDPDTAALLAQTDLLVDGPYVEALRSVGAAFIGSTNQRLIPLTEAGKILKSKIRH